MKPDFICTNFVSRCKDQQSNTYGVWDKDSNEFVDGTEDVDLEKVKQWADQLNYEEDKKQLNLKSN